MSLSFPFKWNGTEDFIAFYPTNSTIGDFMHSEHEFSSKTVSNFLKCLNFQTFSSAWTSFLLYGLVDSRKSSGSVLALVYAQNEREGDSNEFLKSTLVSISSALITMLQISLSSERLDKFEVFRDRRWWSDMYMVLHKPRHHLNHGRRFEAKMLLCSL